MNIKIKIEIGIGGATVQLTDKQTKRVEKFVLYLLTGESDESEPSTVKRKKKWAMPFRNWTREELDTIAHMATREYAWGELDKVVREVSSKIGRTKAAVGARLQQYRIENNLVKPKI